MKFSDYIEGVIDNRGKNPARYFEKEKYPVLDNAYITNELYPNINDIKRYIDQDTYDNFLRGYVYPGMVVITLVGNGIANVTTIPSENIVIIQNTIGFAVKKDLLDDRFLYYFLRNSRNRIRNFDRGVAQPSVKKTDILSMEVTFPDLKVQKKISRYLGMLDEKIEMNNRINKNLEQQAQMIFEDFFFSHTMPSTWSKSTLTGIANYLNGLAMQNYRPSDGEDGLPVLKIKELRQGACASDSELCSPKIKPEYIVHDCDVIFSWSASLLVDFWCGGVCGLNQHLFKVTSDKFDKWYIYAWTKHHLDKFIAIAAGKATTMGHIKRSDLDKAEVLVPSKDDYQLIGSILAPMYDLIMKNRIENRKLAELRDSLLPKLMSGELDVSAIEI